MRYEYKCVNEKCEAHEESVTVVKPMAESDREEKCEKCGEIMSRVYGISGHQTFGDGYKG